MLNVWHLPVAPFVKQNKDQLTITLWLAGENPPQRVTLRAENDNEEISLAMHKQRSQPQPGVTAWRAAIDLSSGQPRRRYSFKLLWLYSVVVHPTGIQPFSACASGAVCRRCAG